MGSYRYSLEKNTWLKAKRGIGFDDVVKLIGAGHAHGLVNHPNQHRYPHQKMIEIEIDGYYYVLPAVQESDGGLFLKTIFPTRKLTKKKRSKK